MNAALGAVLLAAAVLLYAWVYGQFRCPSPKRWTKSEAVSTTMSLILVAQLTFGLAFLVKFAFDFAAETLWPADIVVVVACIIFCLIMVPRLVAPAFR